MKVKLISFNIAIKINNTKEIIDFIKKEKPDIVCFQEIIRHQDESVSKIYKSQKEINHAFAKKLPFYFFGPTWIVDKIIKNNKVSTDFQGFIEQGNEIISKFPIVKATNKFYHKEYSLITDWTNFNTEDHPRNLIQVELNINGKQLQIINLHGTYSKNKEDSERSIKQSKFILEITKRKQMPTIITGDFNLHPQTESIKLISKKFRNLTTKYNIQTTRPKFKMKNNKKDIIDYIFVSKEIKVKSFKVIETEISDHLPLILEFEIKN